MLKKGLAKGAKLAPLSERLAKLGLVRDWDFVLHLPLRYEDQTHITTVDRLQVGETALVEVSVLNSEIVRQRTEQLVALTEDRTGELRVRFLHFYPSTRAQFKPGSHLRLFGVVRTDFHGMPEMVHPKVKSASYELPKTLTPVYPSGESVTQNWLSKRIARALLDVDLTDTVPALWLKKLGLPSLSEALTALHRPAPGADLTALENKVSPEWQRLKFDELLAQQIALRLNRQRKAGLTARSVKSVSGKSVDHLLKALPYALTSAQKRVIRQIDEDLAKVSPMNRLLQGDVGSGKTVVATLAALRAVDAGFQVALMAPTEILAEQHFRKVAKLVTPLGVRVAWLVGSLKPKEKALCREKIASGDYDIVIGTHALISEAVTFHNLALAVIDEQHRFGVEQRLRLRSCAGGEQSTPHLLMLSATPIPRTLAMSYLADMDVSVIDELPPGRTPIRTKLVSLARIDAVARVLLANKAEQRQAYWVCPLIEEDENSALSAVSMRAAWLKNNYPELRVGLLHGALSADDKQGVMHAFETGKLDVLVSTTVVEVGVDVPGANLMIIEQAERFGLAQLHQLRGRVGRGSIPGHCILLFSKSISQNGKERLAVIRNTTDGFAIAREDLRLRGPGEFLGARQSGAPLLKYADPTLDASLLQAARDAATQWIASAPEQAREHARRWYAGREGFLEA